MRLPFAVRRIATRIGGAVAVRIRGGPNAGMKWTLTSAGRGIWQGRFEPDRIALIAAVIRPGHVVWDLGAHKGYVTLLAARLAGANGRVLACEPASANRAALLRHLEWNRPGNVSVEPCAVSGSDGIGRIGGAGSTVAFRLGAGPEAVRVRSLGSLARDHPQPDVIKIDVEGEEANVLHGGRGVLMRAGAIVLSAHTPELYRTCVALLRDAGFEIRITQPIRASLADGEWRGDPDVLAIRADHALDGAAVARLTTVLPDGTRQD